MVAFVVGRTVKTAEPVVTVDAGLPIGVHRFQLEVLTADGRRSAAEVVQVSVQRLLVLDPLRPEVRPPVTDPLTNPTLTTTPLTRPTTTIGTPTPTTTTTTLDPTLLGTTRIRKPRKAATEVPPEPSASTPAAAGRKARGKRRSES
ncbi:MAG: hypothetical protein EYC67_10565 [Betaproteobacteria bacterium]|nr:MAG: hypothetical protein EYC67_10565 [Betaproteobacteria bacterium]